MTRALKTICHVIGKTVEDYSLSPGMHRIIYDCLGIKDWEYSARNIKDADELKGFIKEVRENNYLGFNVTVPYKVTIMESGFLDKVKKSAEGAGAVNTVVNINCSLEGINTDFLGFKNDLEMTLNFYGGENAIILGAGGAGRAAVLGLSGKVKFINVFDIDYARAEKLSEDFNRQRDFPPDVCPVMNMAGIARELNQSALLVNATTVGMTEGEPPVDLRETGFMKGMKVYDIVYNRETELLKTARELGLSASGGIGMLARQGAEAFRWWKRSLGEPFETIPEDVIEKMKDYLREEVNKR